MKRTTALFLSSIAGGVCIALGGTVFLTLKNAFPGGNVVGALLFSVGLFAICTRGYSLYTGKVCYILDHPPSYLIDLLIIWLGNLVGTLSIALLERLTTMSGPTGIDAVATDLVAAKMVAPYLSLFILGCFCGIFIYIAVNGYAKNPHELGKYLAIFLGVSIFIIVGTEHSVADMYYWAISGVLWQEPAQSLLRILVISLGNALGGAFLPLLEHAKARLEPEEKT